MTLVQSLTPIPILTLTLTATPVQTLALPTIDKLTHFLPNTLGKPEKFVLFFVSFFFASSPIRVFFDLNGDYLTAFQSFSFIRPNDNVARRDKKIVIITT